jgi:hypothetical protein
VGEAKTAKVERLADLADRDLAGLAGAVEAGKVEEVP